MWGAWMIAAIAGQVAFAGEGPAGDRLAAQLVEEGFELVLRPAAAERSLSVRFEGASIAVEARGARTVRFAIDAQPAAVAELELLHRAVIALREAGVSRVAQAEDRWVVIAESRALPIELRARMTRAILAAGFGLTASARKASVTVCAVSGAQGMLVGADLSDRKCAPRSLNGRSLESAVRAALEAGVRAGETAIAERANTAPANSEAAIAETTTAETTSAEPANRETTGAEITTAETTNTAPANGETAPAETANAATTNGKTAAAETTNTTPANREIDAASETTNTTPANRENDAAETTTAETTNPAPANRETVEHTSRETAEPANRETAEPTAVATPAPAASDPWQLTLRAAGGGSGRAPAIDPLAALGLALARGPYLARLDVFAALSDEPSIKAWELTAVAGPAYKVFSEGAFSLTAGASAGIELHRYNFDGDRGARINFIAALPTTFALDLAPLALELGLTPSLSRSRRHEKDGAVLWSRSAAQLMFTAGASFSAAIFE